MSLSHEAPSPVASERKTPGPGLSPGQGGGDRRVLLPVFPSCRCLSLQPTPRDLRSTSSSRVQSHHLYAKIILIIEIDRLMLDGQAHVHASFFKKSVSALVSVCCGGNKGLLRYLHVVNLLLLLLYASTYNNVQEACVLAKGALFI